MKITESLQIENNLSNNISFIILGAGRPHKGTIHSGLRHASGKGRIIDWLIEASSVVNPEFIFVGGYQFEDVVKRYPQIRYAFNPEWETTGSAFSLLKIAFSVDKEYYTSYADILFRKSVIDEMARVDADVVIAVDSLWRQRYHGRSDEDLLRCEKVKVESGIVTRLGPDINPDLADGEFVGLARFLPGAIEYINKNIRKLNELLRLGNLSHLVEILRAEGYLIKVVDIYGDWAELNVPEDLTHFVIGNKAQTLQRLQAMVQKSRIEDQVSFCTSEWLIKRDDILSDIDKSFGNQKLIVRSSSANEDNFTTANAGVFKSILNVNSRKIHELSIAIETVIGSYSDKNSANQVLIQPMVLDIAVSGVIFTKTIANGAPYYVVNYDDITRNTDSITNGSSQNHKTMVILRESDINSELIPYCLRGLLPAVQEIEELLHYDSIDIEFAIDSKGQIHILQVRPIVFKGDENQVKNTEQDIYNAIELAHTRFKNLQKPSPFVKGKRAFFGIMPDWNPAEIIGTKPGLLAISLYRYLIMDDVWATQRAEYGYRDVRPSPLLFTFGGHPYVDIRASFNSFIPADVNDGLAERMVEFYMSWLEKNPHLHDKVEFDVVPTCYTFDFEKWICRLTSENLFSEKEVSGLGESLKKITRSAFTRNYQDLDSIATLERRYDSIISKDMNPLDRAIILLEDCRRYGTPAFSHLARSAFIGISLLKSAVNENIISKEAMDSFLNSIHTITHQFTDAAAEVAEGKLTWDAFKQRYGHLRPGTYDITSQSYAENPEYFLRPIIKLSVQKKPSAEPFSHWKEAKNDFSAALKQAELSSDADQVETFIREAIEGREYAKFIFTRNLSEALNCLIEFGTNYGLNRNDLTNIPLDVFVSIRTGSLYVSDIANLLREQSDKGRMGHNLAYRIELPPLLFKEHDFNMFMYPDNQPNFIGTGQVRAECVLIENIETKDIKDISGCIVMIPQADPGYDWLFAKGISGLITMWGGANSHVAIRAAEFGLPAAIGVGEIEFNRLSAASVLELNAGNHLIKIIR